MYKLVKAVIDSVRVNVQQTKNDVFGVKIIYFCEPLAAVADEAQSSGENLKEFYVFFTFSHSRKVCLF